MSSQVVTQGRPPSPIFVAIAVPIVVGVAILLVAFYFVSRRQQRKALSAQDEEYALNGVKKTSRSRTNTAESSMPLLGPQAGSTLRTFFETKPSAARSSNATPVPQTTPDVTTDDGRETSSDEETAESVAKVWVSRTSPNALPSILVSPQAVRGSIGIEQPNLAPSTRAHNPQRSLSKIWIPGTSRPETLEQTEEDEPESTVSLVPRPSFFKKARANLAANVQSQFQRAPVRGSTRRGKAKPSGGPNSSRSVPERQDSSDTSPVSLYSQPSLKRSNTREAFRFSVVEEGNEEVPPVPPLPQPAPSAPVSRKSTISSEHPHNLDANRDSLLRSNSFGGVPSPTQYFAQQSPASAASDDSERVSALLPRSFSDNQMPSATCVTDYRWTGALEPYIPSSPFSPSFQHIGQSSLGHKTTLSVARTKEASWYHSAPRVVDGGLLQDETMVATWQQDGDIRV